jgi:hypothetical protein
MEYRHMARGPHRNFPGLSATQAYPPPQRGEPAAETALTPDPLSLRELRTLAMHLIRHDKLPRSNALRQFGGRGQGGRCALCERCLTREGMELETEFESGDVRTFHVRCFSIWASACDAVKATPLNRLVASLTGSGAQ